MKTDSLLVQRCEDMFTTLRACRAKVVISFLVVVLLEEILVILKMSLSIVLCFHTLYIDTGHSFQLQ